MTLKNLFFIGLMSLLLGCASSPEEQLEMINGYWEIASVETAEGDVKEFGMSENIDFIEVNGKQGVRKKVRANLLGEFQTTPTQENIDVRFENNQLILQYSTAYDQWEERVLKVSEEMLVTKNEAGNTYTYRRYEPLKIPQ